MLVQTSHFKLIVVQSMTMTAHGAILKQAMIDDGSGWNLIVIWVLSFRENTLDVCAFTLRTSAAIGESSFDITCTFIVVQ